MISSRGLRQGYCQSLNPKMSLLRWIANVYLQEEEELALCTVDTPMGSVPEGTKVAAPAFNIASYVLGFPHHLCLQALIEARVFHDTQTDLNQKDFNSPMSITFKINKTSPSATPRAVSLQDKLVSLSRHDKANFTKFLLSGPGAGTVEPEFDNGLVSAAYMAYSHH